MNERIRELYTQVLNESPNMRWNIEDLEKFAELIVQKCAQIAWYHTPDYEELEYGHLISDKIKKHFGVEE